jgi:hypothetical protein
LRLGEAFAGEPGEIAGAGRCIAGQIARDDLALSFIIFAMLEIGMDGNGA